MTTSFDWDAYETEPGEFDWDAYEQPTKKQEPVTLKGTLGSLGTGFAGGAGGAVKDVEQIAKPLGAVFPGVKALSDLMTVSGFKNTPQLTEQLAEQFGIEEPQNALERILQKTGEFSGQEALLGTALGGTTGGGLGAAHGAVSGALYGAAKELGANDTVALIATMLTLSPIAAEKLLSKLKMSKEAKKALLKDAQKTAEAVSQKTGANLNTEVPPPPPAPPPPTAPGGIKSGTELPQTKNAFAEKEKIVEALSAEESPSALGVTAKAPEIHKEVPELKGRTSKAQELGESVSKEPFETDASAGREISRNIQKEREIEHKIVKNAYEEAEPVTQNHYDIYPELASENEARIRKLESLEKRSAGEEAVYQDALTLRKIIGEPDALILASGSKLMKQANSFSQKVKYELPYVGYKGEIKKIVHEMNDSVIRSLEKAGQDASKVVKADKIYSRYADRFMNEHVSDYLGKKILNPEELAKKAISDEATYRSIKNALGSRSSPLVNKMDRELVHKRMDRYYQDPTLINSNSYVRDLKNLSEKIGKEKTAEVDYLLRKRQGVHEKSDYFKNRMKTFAPEQRKLAEKSKPSPIKNKISKEPIYKKPEHLDKAFKEVSDIRKLKKEMKSKGLEKEFDKLASDKVEEIFKEGKYGSKKLTGDDIVKIVDKNHEVLTELLGEDLLDALYKDARIAGEKEMTQNLFVQLTKRIGKLLISKVVGAGVMSSLIKILLR